MINQGAPDLHFAFDVGHSSIGWSVLSAPQGVGNNRLPQILGTGVVTFGADDCLAVKRRKNRQARRHARATRQRIGNIEKLLAHLGVLSADQLAQRHRQAGGDSFSWQRAAEILGRGQSWLTEHATVLRVWLSIGLGLALMGDAIVRQFG